MKLSEKNPIPKILTLEEILVPVMNNSQPMQDVDSSYTSESETEIAEEQTQRIIQELEQTKKKRKSYKEKLNQTTLCLHCNKNFLLGQAQYH